MSVDLLQLVERIYIMGFEKKPRRVERNLYETVCRQMQTN